MIMSVLITATLAATVGSLWIRRHTWRSRFEAGASLNIALQGCAVLLLMSPWASVILGPALHRIVRRWNVEDLLDHMCLIVAVMAIIHHRLARLTNEKQLSGLFRRHIETPVRMRGQASPAGSDSIKPRPPRGVSLPRFVGFAGASAWCPPRRGS